MIKYLSACLLTAGLGSVSLAQADAIFNMVASQDNTTIRSDSVGATTWTVSNDGKLALPGVTIDPGYQTTGQASGLSLQNDSCSGQTLAVGGSCSFTVLIQGKNQPNLFQVSPEVCGNLDGIKMCSEPDAANRLAVKVNMINNPAYAYLLTYTHDDNGNLINALLPVNDQINADNTDTITYGTPLSIPTSNNEGGVVVSPNGTQVYFTDGGTLYTASTGANPQLLNSLTLSPNVSMWDLAVSPDGSKIYVSDYNDAEVFVVDAATHTLLNTIAVSGAAGITVSPDGTKVYLADRDDNSIITIDTATDSVIGNPINVGAAPTALVISPDGTHLYVGNFWSPTLSVVSTATNSVVSTINIGDPTLGVTISPDGTKVYATTANKILVIDTATNEIINTINIETDPSVYQYGIAVTPDGLRAYVSTQNRTVPIINTETNTLLADPLLPNELNSIGHISSHFAG